MASILVNDHRTSILSPSENARLEQDKALESLARFKQIRAANDAPNGQETAHHNHLIELTEITTYSIISHSRDGPKLTTAEATTTDQRRTEGEYSPDNQTTLQVWIEWKD